MTMLSKKAQRMQNTQVCNRKDREYSDGWRGRETYKIANQDEYGEVFELPYRRRTFSCIPRATGSA